MAELVLDDKAPFTFSGGQKVKLVPISLMLLESFDKNHIPPDPPKRKILVAGDVEEEIYDPDDEGYQRLLDLHNAKATHDFLALICNFGIELDLPDNDKWMRQLEAAGVEFDQDLPESAYVQYVCMRKFQDDLKRVTAVILRISGVGEEAIQSWVEMF